MATTNELITAFKEYVERFDKEVGPKEFGEYGTWNQHVVRKMNFDEFVAKYKLYKELSKLYEEILEEGATVSDEIYRSLQEAATDLITRA